MGAGGDFSSVRRGKKHQTPDGYANALGTNLRTTIPRVRLPLFRVSGLCFFLQLLCVPFTLFLFSVLWIYETLSKHACGS